MYVCLRFSLQKPPLPLCFTASTYRDAHTFTFTLDFFCPKRFPLLLFSCLFSLDQLWARRWSKRGLWWVSVCRKSSVTAAARLTKPSERIFFQFLFKGKQSQEDACLSVCLHFQLRNEPVVGVSCCSCRCLPPHPQLSNHKGPITKWEAAAT